MSFVEFFQMGGSMMFVLLAVGLIALPAAVVLPLIAFASDKPKPAMHFAAILAAVGLLTAGLGALARTQGMRTVEQAIVLVDPAEKEALRMEGSSESRVCLVFGLLLAALPLAGACACVARALNEKLDAPATARAVSLAAGIAVLVLGVVGHQAALFTAEHAQVSAPPEMRAALAAEGSRSASGRLKLAAALGTALVLIGAGFFSAGASNPKPAG